MRILGCLVMPTHMVLWPERDGELGAFMQRLTTTHVRRWHLHRKTVGCGHLYQGTCNSFPIEADEHLHVSCGGEGLSFVVEASYSHVDAA